MNRRAHLTVTLSSAMLLASSGCTEEAADPTPAPAPYTSSVDQDQATATDPVMVAAPLMPADAQVHLSVPDGAREGLSLLLAEQVGSAAVNVEIATLNGGAILVTEEPPGLRAFEFPPYASSPTAPRAILSVTSPEGEENLAPREEDFEFGATFRIDKTSTGDPTDNGDNLIQRGLFAEDGQYKIDVDKDRPACRVKGSGGTVQVKANDDVTPGEWYAARCTRRGDVVQLTVLSYDGKAWGQHSQDSQTEGVGSVDWADPTVPLSVGGKVTPRGRVVESASDQFNGLIVDPYLAIGG